MIREEALRGVRGRFKIDSTLKRSLRTRGEVACQFDELSEDILANRIIASTLRSVRRIGSLIHRNNRFYRFLLDVCRLIQDNLISDQSASGAL